MVATANKDPSKVKGYTVKLTKVAEINPMSVPTTAMPIASDSSDYFE